MAMSEAARDELRERNRRRSDCPRCGGRPRDLDEAEITRRADTLEGLRYRQCTGCGHTWSVKGRAR